MQALVTDGFVLVNLLWGDRVLQVLLKQVELIWDIIPKKKHFIVGLEFTDNPRVIALQASSLWKDQCGHIESECIFVREISPQETVVRGEDTKRGHARFDGSESTRVEDTVNRMCPSMVCGNIVNDIVVV